MILDLAAYVPSLHLLHRTPHKRKGRRVSPFGRSYLSAFGLLTPIILQVDQIWRDTTRLMMRGPIGVPGLARGAILRFVEMVLLKPLGDA